MTSARNDITEHSISDDGQERITLDDIKHQAQHVKDITVTETKDAIGRVMAIDTSKQLLIAAGVVLTVVSLAYFLGARRGRRALYDVMD